ncbi:MAG TPA: coenzyme F420-0:L-glutamate ligase [Candidatus Acidoferrum sp.]|nr:coenzyme F420-0:L-glutamate ligase [Candidatus Acidoferrum sp.]
MTKYKMLAITTKYWMPKTDYVKEITNSVRGKIEDGDFIVVSEKAISTAIGNVIDESSVEPTLNSEFIARFWMRTVWGFILGPMCQLPASLLQHLREYPFETGSRHKQVALQHCGLLQTLMFGSEGGIDASNLAYSYVSLPLENAYRIAQKIHRELLQALQKTIVVIITDTDKTYSFRNFHFAPRQTLFRGIHSFGGTLAYVVGRFLGLRRRATPITAAGRELSVEDALEIAELANHARGFGAGRTVWDMAEKFKVDLTDVTWEMLQTVKHKPIVVLRSRR